MSDELLAELLRPGALEARLIKGFPGAAQSGVLIALRVADQTRTVCMGPLERAPTGCITKLFTGTLAFRALSAHGLGPDTHILSLLDVPRSARTPALEAITVRHLVEHSHGLDDSVSSLVPRLANQRIDVLALCQRLSVPALAEPGFGCSYSDAGGWLLGSLLEQLYDRTYPQILRDELFAPLGIRDFRYEDRASGAVDLCPALGRALCVSPADMQRFVDYHLTCGEPWSLGQLSASGTATALPGWSPLESGIRLGWKFFGSGWYGHNSVLEPTPALLRVNPAERTTLFLAATDHSPTAIATALFGKALPGIARLQMPKLLRAAEIAALDTDPFAGVYQNAGMRLEVSRAPDATLELRAYQRAGDGSETQPFLQSRLRPARDGIFFTQPAEPRRLPFVQFVAPAGGTCRFLWNGTALWPRVSGTPERSHAAVRHHGTHLREEWISP